MVKNISAKNATPFFCSNIFNTKCGAFVELLFFQMCKNISAEKCATFVVKNEIAIKKCASFILLSIFVI